MAPKKVLLVDDVELFLDLEKSFFRREDVQLLIARNGRQAVELAQQEQPSLIFMDLFMPEMNGDEACRLIKQGTATSHIPVVMVTHGGREADLDFCRTAGCDEILLKPINRSHFLDTVRHFLQLTERVATRFKTKLSVRYGADTSSLLTDFALNISTGGLFLETAKPLPVETPMTLEFPLPGREHPVLCQARVAWTNEPDNPSRLQLPSGMGLQFLDLKLADLQAIRDYVRQECLVPSD